MNRIELDISLFVRSPFLFPGLTITEFGLDRAALRRPDGRPVLPQDQLRGVLRHAFRDVVQVSDSLDETDEQRLFGRSTGDARVGDTAENANAQVLEPVRGRLFVGDLLAAQKKLRGDRAVRVAICPDRGAAMVGHLQMVELVAPYDQEVEFAGKMRLHATEDEEARWLPGLTAAMTRLTAIGAMKSAGFGEVVSACINKADPLPASASAPTPEREVYRYEATIDRPFLVDAKRAADNVYVGADVIPGGAIKGLLATRLSRTPGAGEISDALTRLSISHARRKSSAPAPPLSLVTATVDGEFVVGDALRVPRDSGALIRGVPVDFAPDWKDGDAVLKQIGYPVSDPLERDVRTHVAIDQKTGTAIDQQLFVINAVEPGDEVWHFEVDFSRIADEQKRSDLAAALEGSLDGLGRTGATLTTRREDRIPEASRSIHPIKGETELYAVILTTDGALVDPGVASDAWDAYAIYWSKVCPEAVLENFFAAQELAGDYLARRFRPTGSYRPFWLTKAGSVFLLRGDLTCRLHKLVRNGLPPPRIGGIETTWRTCPFQPENGYGRIRVDYDAALTSVVDHV